MNVLQLPVLKPWRPLPLSPTQGLRRPHPTARPQLEGMTSPSGPGCSLVWVSVCPKQTARSQKTALLLLPTTTQEKNKSEKPILMLQRNKHLTLLGRMTFYDLLAH